MTVPTTNRSPAFSIRRASHISLAVSDLKASIAFYTEVIGLVVSAQGDDVAYLRGVEESAHHSLTLVQKKDQPSCLRLGFRVDSEAELDRAFDHFSGSGRNPAFVDVPHQGRTLHVPDSMGVPLEFCATMPAQHRLHDQFHVQKGGAALRYDHVQLLAPDVAKASEFYTDLGFRISDYFVDGEHDEKPLGIFMYRKNNPHDIVFLTRPGPVLHHFAYIVADSTFLFRALDTGGSLGYASNLERGPARHGEGHALYVYFRDPDGHRVEIMSPPIQMGDAEDVPMRWHRGNRHSWEYPAPKSWLYEASKFEGVEIEGKGTAAKLRSLEDFLANRPLKVAE
ncbi:VOC family protein [Rhizobium sullae]|uniref:Catechol 2,3-dioxygenase n=1 Tax=Rhizobium sullae TaxID=50338 RepID=A0A4R3PS09_RHISU|nr:VOC family protein [Rhizobium sullae]TCU06070.1 catechol 2,3-dioxygenase [Rhizobium sullae]UWU19174.1 VOC family protein [Rhizobium sullae]